MTPSPPPRSSLRWINLLLNVMFFMMFTYMTANYVVNRYFPGLLNAVPEEIATGDKDLQANKIAAAQAHFDHYLGSHRKDTEAYALVTRSCLLRKQYDMATKYALEGVQAAAGSSHAEQASAYEVLTETYEEGDHPQYEAALSSAEKALKLAPDDPEALNAVGYSLAESRTSLADLDRAVSLTARALDLLNTQVNLKGISSFPILDSYGWALYQRGVHQTGTAATNDFARSVDALTQAVAGLTPDALPDAAKIFYYHYACALNKAGLPEEARNNLRIALHYDPKYEAAINALHAIGEHASPIVTAPQSTGSAQTTGSPVGTFKANVAHSIQSGFPAFTPLNRDRKANTNASDPQAH